MIDPEKQESSGPKITESKEIITPLVGLPEYLKQETLAGLMPGINVYLKPEGLLVFDQKTGGIYIDTGTEITDDSDSIPGYQTDRSGLIAVMHVYDETGSHYIVDARGVEPGQIGTDPDLLQEHMPVDERYTSATRQNTAPLSAVAFQNLEGEVELHGDPLYFDQLRGVVEQYDEDLAKHLSEC